MEVISIGDLFIDLISSPLDEPPLKDAQKTVDNLSISTGGCAANFSLACARLGLRSRFIGKIGNDIFRNFILESLREVDLQLSFGSKTGLTYAINFNDGTRSFITYPGANKGFTINDINLDLMEGRHLHVASFFLTGLKEGTLKLFDFAHSKGLTTSFDTGWDPQGWSEEGIEIIKRILPSVDIFFPNLNEARMITGKGERVEVCDELLSLGVKIIALKLGKSGSYIVTEKEKVDVPAFKVKITDTTGAGDAYNAGFIYGYLKKWGPKKIGRFANATGALSITNYGTGSYPSAKQVKRLVR